MRYCLPELAAPLKKAGLGRINVHLDSLNPETVERQMRWGSFDKIWSGIMAAEAAGLTPIKLNAVVTAGYNEADVMDLARLTIERDWHVRFIELMPLGGGECARLSVARYVSEYRDAATHRNRARKAHRNTFRPTPPMRRAIIASKARRASSDSSARSASPTAAPATGCG